MITGRFDRGRPYIECRIVIPRFRISQRAMFLLDTGADATCLHLPDAIRIGIPFPQLRRRARLGGIGGASPYFREQAFLLFDEEVETSIYQVSLLIAEPNDSNRTLPSLLGRDVVNRWRVNYDPANNTLECTVRSADHIVATS